MSGEYTLPFGLLDFAPQVAKPQSASVADYIANYEANNQAWRDSYQTRPSSFDDTPSIPGVDPAPDPVAPAPVETVSADATAALLRRLQAQGQQTDQNLGISSWEESDWYHGDGGFLDQHQGDTDNLLDYMGGDPNAPMDDGTGWGFQSLDGLTEAQKKSQAMDLAQKGAGVLSVAAKLGLGEAARRQANRAYPHVQPISAADDLSHADLFFGSPDDIQREREADRQQRVADYQQKLATETQVTAPNGTVHQVQHTDGGGHDLTYAQRQQAGINGNTSGAGSIDRILEGGGNDNSSGGGCFITTAAVDHAGEADDGPTLTAMRKLRDQFASLDQAWKEKVGQYYEEAPAIVEALNSHPDAKGIYAEIYKFHLIPIRELVRVGLYEQAANKYEQLFRWAKRTADGK